MALVTKLRRNQILYLKDGGAIKHRNWIDVDFVVFSQEEVERSIRENKKLDHSDARNTDIKFNKRQRGSK